MLRGDEFRWKEEIGLMCRMPVLCKASSVKVDMVEYRNYMGVRGTCHSGTGRKCHFRSLDIGLVQEVMDVRPRIDLVVGDYT